MQIFVNPQKSFRKLSENILLKIIREIPGKSIEGIPGKIFRKIDGRILGKNHAEISGEIAVGIFKNQTSIEILVKFFKQFLKNPESVILDSKEKSSEVLS